jgi:antitoxin component of RelBE/YafQ-DinJ toxin-antitoxin module
MIRPGWALKTKLDKAIRLRLPAYVLVELYNLKAETGLTISEIVRLMLENVLSREEMLREIFEPYVKYYQQKLKQQKIKQQQQQKQQEEEDDLLKSVFENEDDWNLRV